MKVFSPLKKDFISQNFFVVDVETYSLNANQKEFWFGTIYGENYTAVFHTIEEFYIICKDKRFYKSIIFAHNGGRFDYTVLFDNILKKKPIYVRNSFICFKENDITFADSFNLYKTSVKALGKVVGIEKLELKNIGNIKRGSKPTKIEIEYCLRDCEIVYEALAELFNGNKPKITLASFSMELFKRNFLKEKYYQEPNIEKQFIAAYYGGRTECFKLGRVKLNYYDIKSMYAYIQLKTALPDPKPSGYTKVKNPKLNEVFYKLLNCTEGMIKATVISPNMKYPVLPSVGKDKQLIFANGIISGAWTLLEFRYALSKGYKIKKVDFMLYTKIFVNGKDLFGDYVNNFYSIKESKKGIEKLNAKALLTGLYGKFAQKNKSYIEYFESKELAQEFIINEFKEKRFGYEIKEYQKSGKTRKDCLVTKDEDNFQAHSIISWAAYITSGARIKLHGLLEKYNALYCDTDSIFCEQSIKPILGNNMGDLEQKEGIVTMLYSAKDYVIWEKDENGKAKRLEVHKGVPKKATKINSKSYEYDGIIGLKAALRRNIEIGTVIKFKKTLKRKYNKATRKRNKITPFVLK